MSKRSHFKYYKLCVGNDCSRITEDLFENWPKTLKLDEIDNFNECFNVIQIEPQIVLAPKNYWMFVSVGNQQVKILSFILLNHG